MILPDREFHVRSLVSVRFVLGEMFQDIERDGQLERLMQGHRPGVCLKEFDRFYCAVPGRLGPGC
jgi:hypothetical protein